MAYHQFGVGHRQQLKVAVLLPRCKDQLLQAGHGVAGVQESLHACADLELLVLFDCFLDRCPNLLELILAGMRQQGGCLQACPLVQAAQEIFSHVLYCILVQLRAHELQQVVSVGPVDKGQAGCPVRQILLVPDLAEVGFPGGRVYTSMKSAELSSVIQIESGFLMGLPGLICGFLWGFGSPPEESIHEALFVLFVFHETGVILQVRSFLHSPG